MFRFMYWEEFLYDNLIFPFEGIIDEYQEKGSIKEGDKVVVMGIYFEDDLYGVIADIKWVGKSISFQL